MLAPSPLSLCVCTKYHIAQRGCLKEGGSGGFNNQFFEGQKEPPSRS